MPEHRLTSRIGYALLRAGVRLPRIGALSEYNRRAQLLDLIEAHDINCVFDVGANKGWFASGLRAAGYKGDLFCFEPIRADYEIIKGLAAGDEKWRAFPFALGDKAEKRAFNVVTIGEETTTLSSFLETTRDYQSATVCEEVEIRTIDDVFGELPFTGGAPRILLKIDTQGFDPQVVRGAEKSLAHVRLLQSEIAVQHIYKGAMHYTEALSFYESFGFRLVDLHIVNRTREGGVLEYDCVMMKPDLAQEDF